MQQNPIPIRLGLLRLRILHLLIIPLKVQLLILPPLNRLLDRLDHILRAHQHHRRPLPSDRTHPQAANRRNQQPLNLIHLHHHIIPQLRVNPSQLIDPLHNMRRRRVRLPWRIARPRDCREGVMEPIGELNLEAEHVGPAVAPAPRMFKKLAANEAPWERR